MSIIYAHVHHDHSMEAATRVEKLLSAALAGKAVNQGDDKPTEGLPELDADLIRALAERLSKEGMDSARLRSIVAQVIASEA